MDNEINQIINETEKENSVIAEVMKMALRLKEENESLKKYYSDLCSYNSIHHDPSHLDYQKTLELV